jgi:hypothetical protein
MKCVFRITIEYYLYEHCGANAAVLAASYAQQGRSEDGARTVAMIRRSDPAFDSDAFGHRHRSSPIRRDF